jgi:hypothetical protein
VAEVRRQAALKLEQRAYKVSNDLYGRSAPVEPASAALEHDRVRRCSVRDRYSGAVAADATMPVILRYPPSNPADAM